jgi:predicted amidohydrolase
MLQIMPEGTAEANLEKGMKYCRKAKGQGAHIAIFPEMWNTGYEVINEMAVSSDSDFVKSFGEMAKELDMAIGITYLEKYEPMPRNTVTLFDRYGNNVLTYAKLHTCDFSEESMLTPGDDFYVADLDIDSEIIKIGAMICYDREFPESARILMLKGAEIILVPNACPMEINRISQLRGRAYENMVGIATVNYPEGKPDCNGHSNAFDGIAHKPDETESRDTMIMEGDGNEGMFIAEFPIDEMREYRSREVHGNAYRRPDKYGLLVSDIKEEPFIRKDYRKREAT